jgi:predicted metal-dependent HD superfamily phosphohydrolase
VGVFILATASHLAGDAAGDKAWFLDFDLAVLGADDAAYEKYADDIRKVITLRALCFDG